MIRRWLRAHPLLGYFVLAYGNSWASILIIVAASGFRIAVPSLLATGLIFVVMLLGPSVSGLALTALVDGRDGLRDLWARLLRWKVGAGWFALALLTAPLFLLTILLVLSVIAAPAFAPKFQWALLAVGLVAGSFEEIGWTGFATSRVLQRMPLEAAGLVLGLIWAIWHLPVAFLYSYGAMGSGWVASFAIVYLATLTPYRSLMMWVYANTQSILPAVLMHAAYTGWRVRTKLMLPKIKHPGRMQAISRWLRSAARHAELCADSELSETASREAFQADEGTSQELIPCNANPASTGWDHLGKLSADQQCGVHRTGRLDRTPATSGQARQDRVRGATCTAQTGIGY